MRKSRRLLLLFILTASASSAADVYYRSNELGMPLERIPAFRRHESVWVLGVERSGDREVRRLYQEGTEARRWDTGPLEGGVKREEREIIAGDLAAYRVYTNAGDMLLEELYENGTVTQRSVFTYSNTRLVAQRVQSADGSVASTTEYVYSTKGGLRAVRRTAAGGDSAASIFVSGAPGIAEERNSVGDSLFVSRFDARGRRINAERRKADERTLREDFVFQQGSDRLATSAETRPLEGKSIARSYDDKGFLASESVQIGEKVVERTDLTVDDQGKIMDKTRRSADGFEEWRYAWGPDGKKEREEYRRRGMLEKITTFVSVSARTEELYNDGELFLKVYFEGDRRVREELYRNGALLRERKFE
jgi:antitoxin component YwqK of YwqJK toxin-antitoxin module